MFVDQYVNVQRQKINRTQINQQIESGKGHRTIKMSRVGTDGVSGIRFQFAIRTRTKLPRWTNCFHKKLFVRLHARTLCHYTCTNNSGNMYSSHRYLPLASISISLKPLYPCQIQVIIICPLQVNHDLLISMTSLQLRH